MISNSGSDSASTSTYYSSANSYDHLSADEDARSTTIASMDWDDHPPGLDESWLYQIDSLDEECCNPFRLLQMCSFCFGPKSGIQQKRNDCFMPVDASEFLVDRGNNSSPFQSYTPTLARIQEHKATAQVQFDVPNATKTNIFTPLLQRLFQHSPNRCRQTPISVGSLASNIGSLNQSSTTLHRRVDISAGFFTLSTLEAIHSDNLNESSVCSTPSSRLGNVDDRRASVVKRSAYQTPARPRINSEVLRKAIGEVTCEKRAHSSDDDVSPIESDDGDGFNFSLFNAEMRRSELSSRSKSPFTSSEVQKKLVFGDRRHADVLDNEVGKLDGSKPSFLEFDKAIESIHTLVFGPKEVVCKSDIPNETIPRKSLFLRQSVSFIKALRKTGRDGRVLIEGWVAFRRNVSWRDISINTKRCDFRYIILMDDIPILHLFSTQPKRKKGEPKVNPLDTCMNIDLTQDVEVGASLASKELGHEVFLMDEESNNLICSLLPVAMKNEVFLDKHRSRLGKGVLANVFRTDSASKVTLQDQRVSSNTYASIEQNDSARHLLFVLSAAITFPPPRDGLAVGT